MIQFIQLLFNVLASILESLIEIASDIAVQAVPSRRKMQYNADFGKPEAILKKGGDGFYVGSWSNSGKEAHNHLIAFGGSGSGKSTSIVFTTLLQSHNCSYIIHDPSREIFNGTSKALHNAGYKISVLDYNNPQVSQNFNALSYCTSQTDAYKLANIIIRNALEGASYDYWAQSAESAIALFMKYLITYAEPQYRTIVNVIHLIRFFSFAPKKIDRIFVASADTQLISQYKSLVATPEKTRQSTISTALIALRIYESPNIAQITSQNSIEFDDFRIRKHALYICSSASDAYLYRSITASFFESFFSNILHKTPGNEGLPITFLIDEASSMKLPSLPQALALTRKNAVSIATLWQDYNQIEHLYGKNEAVNIFANSHLKVFMPSGQPLETCSMLEKLIGRYSYIDDKDITRTRELLTAQEIHELDKLLVLSGNKPPLLLKPSPYYENKKLKSLASLPPYELEEQLLFPDTPLIEFNAE